MDSLVRIVAIYKSPRGTISSPQISNPGEHEKISRGEREKIEEEANSSQKFKHQRLPDPSGTWIMRTTVQGDAACWQSQTKPSQSSPSRTSKCNSTQPAAP